MATSLTSNAPAIPYVHPIAAEKTATVPWYVWCAAFAVTSIMIGGHWDISWHSSIGRDTFWTPAHMAIYLGAALSGIAFGFLILHTTFAKDSPLRKSSVQIWGFRAPLGAFIASWGGITMLTSAPFDNWWHSAYGLDVKIISPPHIVLFVGIYAIVFGTMILIAGRINHAEGAVRLQLDWLFLYVAGVMLTILMLMLMEYTSRAYLHTSLPYMILAAFTPIALAIGSRVTRQRYAATTIAAVYTFVNLAFIWILPLFPAEPKLGPVYQHVTQFVPPQFPILLLIPALAVDLIWNRFSSWNDWKLAIVSGFTYVALLIGTEWFFASFLMSPAARNGFFGTQYFYYALPPQSFLARNLFVPNAGAASLWTGFGIATLIGILSIRWALSRGNAMRQVQR